MTAKIDGTNGVLQAYAYTVPVSGFNYTVPLGTQVVLLEPATTLASGTVTLPAAPSDGMVVTISTTQEITSFTVAANTGQSISASPTLFLQDYSVAYIYKESTTTWYTVQTVFQQGYQLNQATEKNTSSTAVSFTGIPSWAKRVTVMLDGVSTTGTSPMLIQLGDSGGYEATGYVGNSTYSTSSSATTNYTTGFGIYQPAAATYTVSGSMILTQMDSATNKWVEFGVFSAISGATYPSIMTSGVKSLSSSLDRLQLTTVAGTDTFDLGSINIMYE